MHVRYDEIDGFIKIHNGIRYLVLFDFGWLDKICSSIKYLLLLQIVLQIVLIITLQKSKLIYIILCPLQKYWKNNVTIIIKSVVNKNKNNYYHNIFLEKGSYKDKSNTEYS